MPFTARALTPLAPRAAGIATPRVSSAVRFPGSPTIDRIRR